MADIAIQPVWQVLDGNGNPLPGAKVTFYNTGTVTPQTVYQDTGLTTPHASPVVANSNGVVPAVYLTGSVVAKAVITTSADVAVATIDPLPADALTASAASQVSFAPSAVNATTTVQAAIDNIDGRIGAVSAFAKTLLDDADRAALMATLGGVNTFTAVQTTISGTAVDFTGIPSWVTEVYLVTSGVSLSGTDNILTQLGDSGGIEVTGYVAGSTGASTGVVTASSTSGFLIFAGAATSAATGVIGFVKVGATNEWVSHHSLHGGIQNIHGGGTKTLSATLDRLRITRTGTDTFDAGSAIIMYR